jgi:hypothetical protein
VLKGYTQWGDAVYIESDGCCSQFWCKERFWWNDTWVNPFADHPSESATRFQPPQLRPDQEVADLLLEQADLGAFIRNMKSVMRLKLYEASRNARKHGKGLVDAIGHHTNKQIMIANKLPLESFPEGLERVRDAVTALQLLRRTERGVRGLTAPIESERARIKSTGQRYEIMPQELVVAVAAIRAPCVLKTTSGTDPGTGEGSSTWFTVQHHAGFVRQPRSRKLSCPCKSCINPTGRDSESTCEYSRRLGEWKLWKLEPLLRVEEAAAIRSFIDGLCDGSIVVLTVPENYDDDSDYWLMKVTKVETVGNRAGVEDSVGRKVKAGDSILVGRFFEKLPWYKDNDRDRGYFLQGGEEARMDTRHCMRGLGDIAKEVKTCKAMASRQRKDLDTHDNRRYTIYPLAHERIMELVDPRGIVPVADSIRDS